jgi:hypothetical protein
VTEPVSQRVSGLARAALLSLALALPAGAQAADPFTPGLRWTRAADVTAPWLPRSVSFAEGGELLLAAGSIGAPRTMLFSTAESPASSVLAPLSEALHPNAEGTVQTAAGPGADAFYTLVQEPHAGPTVRRTSVVRHAAPGGVLTPQWTRALPLVGNGAARVAADRTGAVVVVAVHDTGSSQLLVEWLDAATGAPLATRTVGALALRELSISADASRVALVAGAALWILDGQGGVVHQEALPLATNALALSGDGRRLLVGDGARVRVLEENGGWSQRSAVQAPVGETIVRVAISDDGTRWAAGWWRQLTGVDVRFQVWDSSAADSLLYEVFQSGTPGGLQGYPEVVAITPDGSRAAFGTWGTGDPQPEVMLVDADTGTLVFERDLPGSVRALALDSTGTRIGVGMKHGHANAFAATGEVRLYDTGERDLQVVGSTLGNGTLHLAAKRPGATRALFVLGTLRPTPNPFPGSGNLWIERSAPLRVYSRPVDPSGRADLILVLPQLPAWLGLDFGAQAAWRVSGGLELGATAVDPVVF